MAYIKYWISILFLIFSARSASDYYLDEITAREVSQRWNIEESNQTVGYPVAARFFKDDNPKISHKKINILSPGLYLPGDQPSLRTTHAFDFIPGRKLEGWLPGDFFIIDSVNEGRTKESFNKNVLWGQNADAYAFIYCLNRLYDGGSSGNGIRHFTVHGHCYGTQRIINMLYYLSNNQQTDGTENFFLEAGIDRIKRGKILESIETICLQVPLKNPVDGPLANVYNRPYIKGLEKILMGIGAATTLAAPLLQNNKNLSQSLFLTGIGLFCLPAIVITQNYIFNTDKKIIKNIFLPYEYNNYDSSHISPERIFQALDYFKQEYPHMALFMTTAKNDRFVGDWNVSQFFNTFPVNDDRKYLIPSNQFGHRKVTKKQLFAKVTFLKHYASSYVLCHNSVFKEGNDILDFAQKGQHTNIEEYITFMQSDQNDDEVVSDNH